MTKQPARVFSSVVAAMILGLTALGGGAPQEASASAPAGLPNTPVQLFATLPPNVPGNPEGMTSDSSGNIYVNSFNTGLSCPSATISDAGKAAVRALMGAMGGGPATASAIPPGTPNFIFVYDASGNLKAQVPFVACAAAPLGMQIIGTQLFVIDVFSGTVYRYNLPLTNTSTPDRSYDVCGGFLAAFGGGSATPATSGFCALNDMKLGPDGRLYMSDNGAGPSFVGPPGFLTGRIFVLDPVSGASSVFFQDQKLNVQGEPEFGVVSNVFSPDGKTLYMSNFSSDFIYSTQVSPQNPNLPPSLANPLATPTGALNVVFHNSSIIAGPNHMAFDNSERLWVTGGENNTVVALQATPNGPSKAVASAGTFCGFSANGAPACLLQPANVVFANGQLYVGNEANQGLSPRNTDLPPTDPAWTNTLKLWTVSKFTPPVGTLGGKSFGVSSSGGKVLLSWAGGVGQSGYVVARLANNGLTVLPNGTALAANATSFVDSTPVPGINCYLLATSAPGFGALTSDFECVSVGLQNGNPPQDFTIELNQGFQATLSWAPPAGGAQTSYSLATIGGGVQQIGSAETSVTVPVTGFTCFMLQAKQGNGVLGTSEAVCAQPGFATPGQ